MTRGVDIPRRRTLPLGAVPILAAFWLFAPIPSAAQDMQTRASSLESANAVENFSRSLDYLKKALTEQASRLEEQVVAIDKSGPPEVQKGLIKEVKLIVRSIADQISVTLDSSVQACEFVKSNIERLVATKDASRSELVGLWMRLENDCVEARTQLIAARADLEALLRAVQEQEVIFKEQIQLKAFANAAKVAQQLVGETRNTFGKIRDDVYKTKLPGVS